MNLTTGWVDMNSPCGKTEIVQGQYSTGGPSPGPYLLYRYCSRPKGHPEPCFEKGPR